MGLGPQEARRISNEHAVKCMYDEAISSGYHVEYFDSREDAEAFVESRKDFDRDYDSAGFVICLADHVHDSEWAFL